MTETDPLLIWGKKEIVESFEKAPPNKELINLTRMLMGQNPAGFTVVDIGCGAGRNLIPLLELGLSAFAADMSPAMVESAKRRATEAGLGDRLTIACANHDGLPFDDGCADLVIAHGVWNLARSDREFIAAMRESARLTKSGGTVFIFTFHRETISPDSSPLQNQVYCYDDFAGYPQCFVNEAEIETLLASCGLKLSKTSVKIFNRQSGLGGSKLLKSIPRSGAPVIMQATATKP